MKNAGLWLMGAGFMCCVAALPASAIHIGAMYTLIIVGFLMIIGGMVWDTTEQERGWPP